MKTYGIVEEGNEYQSYRCIMEVDEDDYDGEVYHKREDVLYMLSRMLDESMVMPSLIKEMLE